MKTDRASMSAEEIAREPRSSGISVEAKPESSEQAKLWRGHYYDENERRIKAEEMLRQLRAREQQMREALEGWIKIAATEINKTAEQQNSEYNHYWRGRMSALREIRGKLAALALPAAQQQPAPAAEQEDLEPDEDCSQEALDAVKHIPLNKLRKQTAIVSEEVEMIHDMLDELEGVEEGFTSMEETHTRLQKAIVELRQLRRSQSPDDASSTRIRVEAKPEVPAPSPAQEKARVTELAGQNCDIRDALGLQIATHEQVLAKIRQLMPAQEKPVEASVEALLRRCRLIISALKCFCDSGEDLNDKDRAEIKELFADIDAALATASAPPAAAQEGSDTER